MAWRNWNQTKWGTPNGGSINQNGALQRHLLGKKKLIDGWTTPAKKDTIRKGIVINGLGIENRQLSVRTFTDDLSLSAGNYIACIADIIPVLYMITYYYTLLHIIITIYHMIIILLLLYATIIYYTHTEMIHRNERTGTIRHLPLPQEVELQAERQNYQWLEPNMLHHYVSYDITNITVHSWVTQYLYVLLLCIYGVFMIIFMALI